VTPTNTFVWIDSRSISAFIDALTRPFLGRGMVGPRRRDLLASTQTSAASGFSASARPRRHTSVPLRALPNRIAMVGSSEAYFSNHRSFPALVRGRFCLRRETYASEVSPDQKTITYVTAAVTCLSIEAHACVTITPNAPYAGSAPQFGSASTAHQHPDHRRRAGRLHTAANGYVLHRSAGRVSRLQRCLY